MEKCYIFGTDRPKGRHTHGHREVYIDVVMWTYYGQVVFGFAPNSMVSISEVIFLINDCA